MACWWEVRTTTPPLWRGVACRHLHAGVESTTTPTAAAPWLAAPTARHAHAALAAVHVYGPVPRLVTHLVTVPVLVPVPCACTAVVPVLELPLPALVRRPIMMAVHRPAAGVRTQI